MHKVDEIIQETFQKELNNAMLIDMYYKIGKLINDKKIDKKLLEQFLKEKYGVVIAFTERNFKFMTIFSNIPETELDKYKLLPWKLIIVLLKRKDLIDLCLEYHPTKYQLENYIKNNKKLEKNDYFELDDTLEELKKLQTLLGGKL
jgi:hypothetical protein